MSAERDLIEYTRERYDTRKTLGEEKNRWTETNMDLRRRMENTKPLTPNKGTNKTQDTTLRARKVCTGMNTDAIPTKDFCVQACMCEVRVFTCRETQTVSNLPQERSVQTINETSQMATQTDIATSTASIQTESINTVQNSTQTPSFNVQDASTQTINQQKGNSTRKETTAKEPVAPATTNTNVTATTNEPSATTTRHSTEPTIQVKARETEPAITKKNKISEAIKNNNTEELLFQYWKSRKFYEQVCHHKKFNELCVDNSVFPKGLTTQVPCVTIGADEELQKEWNKILLQCSLQLQNANSRHLTKLTKNVEKQLKEIEQHLDKQTNTDRWKNEQKNINQELKQVHDDLDKLRKKKIKYLTWDKTQTATSKQQPNTMTSTNGQPRQTQHNVNTNYRNQQRQPLLPIPRNGNTVPYNKYTPPQPPHPSQPQHNTYPKPPQFAQASQPLRPPLLQTHPRPQPQMYHPPPPNPAWFPTPYYVHACKPHKPTSPNVSPTTNPTTTTFSVHNTTSTQKPPTTAPIHTPTPNKFTTPSTPISLESAVPLECPSTHTTLLPLPPQL